MQLIRSDQELGNEYIENDPTVEEIQDVPTRHRFAQRVMDRATSVAATFCIILPHCLPH
jgi:hypothetical protein